MFRISGNAKPAKQGPVKLAREVLMPRSHMRLGEKDYSGSFRSPVFPKSFDLLRHGERVYLFSIISEDPGQFSVGVREPQAESTAGLSHIEHFPAAEAQ